MSEECTPPVEQKTVDDHLNADEDALGGLLRYDDGIVVHPNGELLVTEDGIEPRYVQSARNEREVAENRLWSRIGPLQYGDITVRRNAKVYHDDRETWLVAETIDLLHDGEPRVTFAVQDSWPREKIVLDGSHLADLVEEDVLRSEAAVERDLMNALEDYQGDGDD